MKRLGKISLFVFAFGIVLVCSNFIIERGFKRSLQGLQQNSSKKDSLVHLQNGDIIFQSSFSGQSKAIQLATHSKFSHVGILFLEGNQWFVYEAVQPVKKTTFEKWITHGDNSAYKIMRLKNASQVLNASKVATLKEECVKHLNKDYDLAFEWTDNRMYCSELVWKAYHQALQIDIGKLQLLKEFDLSHPIVKQKLAERYGSGIPYDEPVISPGSMAESDLLMTVTDTF